MSLYKDYNIIFNFCMPSKLQKNEIGFKKECCVF